MGGGVEWMDGLQPFLLKMLKFYLSSLELLTTFTYSRNGRHELTIVWDIHGPRILCCHSLNTIASSY